ncbi:MAG: acyltransferase [Nibricoccus sp.]
MQPASPASSNRLFTIDYLRGLAALLVALCHFKHTLPVSWHEHVSEIGQLGVQIFFVISGFIIPYGMFRARYTIRCAGHFYLKRLLRLHPPFLVALALTLLLSAGAALARSIPVGWSALDILRFTVYAAVPPENPVFWTLIVELKYYVFVSLLFPVFFGGRVPSTIALLLCAGASYAFVEQLPVLKHLPYFLVGFVACRHFLGLATKMELLVLTAVILAAASRSSWTGELLAGAFTATAILYTPVFHSRVLAYFGDISYSLYLIHFPIGVKLINLLAPHCPGHTQLLLLPAALAASTLTAHLLFLVIERPSIVWSQRIKYPTRLIPSTATA